MQRDLTIFTLFVLTKLLKSSGKTRFQAKRPEESRDAKHAYHLKASTAKMDCDHVARMPD